MLENFQTVSEGEFSEVQRLAAARRSVSRVMSSSCSQELLGPQGCETNGLGNFDRIHFWRTPVAACASQGGQCVPYYRWVTDYIAVLGGR